LEGGQKRDTETKGRYLPNESYNMGAQWGVKKSTHIKEPEGGVWRKSKFWGYGKIDRKTRAVERVKGEMRRGWVFSYGEERYRHSQQERGVERGRRNKKGSAKATDRKGDLGGNTPVIYGSV